MKTERIFAAALVAAALVAAAIVVVLMLVGYRDCRRQGGHYVRGLFRMECIR